MRFCCIPQGVASLWGSANPCLFRVFCLECHQWFWFCFVFFIGHIQHRLLPIGIFLFVTKLSLLVK